MTHFRTTWRKNMPRFTLLVALLCGSLLGAGNAAARTLIVQAGQSIQAQLSTLGPGDTLMVRAGTYDESLSLPTSGTPGNPIVLMAYPGEKPIIQSSSTLLSLNKSYWIIDGFILDHKNASSDAIKIRSSASNNAIRNCEIRNGKRDAIDIAGGATDHVIENNVIHDFVWSRGNDAHGIVTNPGVQRLQILNNTIYNTGGDCIQLYASDSDPVSSYAKDITIKGNRFYTTLGADSENALDFKGVDGGVVQGNEMYGFENKAVVVQKGCRNLRFEDNVIHDSQRGMEFRGEGGKSQENMIIARNTLYNIRQYYAVKFDDVDNVRFVNNTIALVSPTALRIEGAGVTNSVFKNNVFYQTGDPKLRGTFDAQVGYNGWFGVSPSGMAGDGDISGSDPGFVNPANGDFRLQGNSPLIDAGTDVGLPYKGSAPDLGAHEYGAGTTPVQLVQFSGVAGEKGVHLQWRTAAESQNVGFVVERSRDQKQFRTLRFIRAQGGSGGVYSFTDREVAPGTYYYRLRQLNFDGSSRIVPAIQVVVPVPEGFLLEQNAPNPFSLARAGQTRITFFMPRPESVRLRIYNILGQRLRDLYVGLLDAGRQMISWDGRDELGNPVAPGLYFYELRAGAVRLVRRLAVIR